MGNKSSSSTGLQNDKPYQPTLELLDNMEKRISKSLSVVQAQKNNPNVKDLWDEMLESELELHRFNEDMGQQIGKTDLEGKLEEEKKKNHLLEQESRRLKTCIDSKDKEIQNLKAEIENLRQDKTIQNLQTSYNREEALQAEKNISDPNQENVLLRNPKKDQHGKEQFSRTIPQKNVMEPQFSNTSPKINRRCNPTTDALSARENISISQDEIPKQSAIKQLAAAAADSQSASTDSVRVESVEENEPVTQDTIYDTPENDVPPTAVQTSSSGSIISSDTPNLKTNKGSSEKTVNQTKSMSRTCTAPSFHDESRSKQFAQTVSYFQGQATPKPGGKFVASKPASLTDGEKHPSASTSGSGVCNTVTKNAQVSQTTPIDVSEASEAETLQFELDDVEAKNNTIAELTTENAQLRSTVQALQAKGLKQEEKFRIISSDTPNLKTNKGSSEKTVNQIKSMSRTCTAPSSHDESRSKQFAQTVSYFQGQATPKPCGKFVASKPASLTDGEKHPSASTPGSGVCNTVTKNAQVSQTTPTDVSETSEEETLQFKLADVEAKNNIIAELTTENAQLRSTVQALQAKALKQEEKISSLTEQNEELTNRLSRIAGQKLLENNPAITDLSDPNRPLKLGEVYCEIYDNEWTDAFEELHEVGYSEDECIDTLRLTLLNAWQFCQRKSEDLLKKTSEAVDILFEEYKQIPRSLDIFGSSRGHLTVPRKSAELFGKILKSLDNEDIQLQRRWKPKDLLDPRTSLRCSMKVETPDIVSTKLKHFRKEVADSIVPLVQRAYLSASWNSDCISAMKPFIMKCLFLGWMMVVQSPPLSFATCKPGESFNKDMYREYTKSGPKVEYVVWPTLLLHEGGPMIGKGVAQGMQT